MLAVVCDQCKDYRKDQNYAFDDSGCDGYDSWSYTLCLKCYKKRMYDKDVVIAIHKSNTLKDLMESETASVRLLFKDLWQRKKKYFKAWTVVYTGPLGDCLENHSKDIKKLPTFFIHAWFAGDEDFDGCSPYINDDAWTDDFKQQIYDACKSNEN